MFDTLFAIIRRLAHGQNPMAPDRGHIHHRLIDMGFSQKQAVAIAYMLTGILGLAAVLLTSSGELKALILIAAIFYCQRYRLQADLLEERPGRGRAGRKTGGTA